MPPHRHHAAVLAATLAFGLMSAGAFAQDRETSPLRRGAHLVKLGGCADCHTPFKMGANGPEKDLTRGLSGHPEALRLPPPPKLGSEWNWAGAATMTAFVGPWGMTFATNLTPDRETGIGTWKPSEFTQAMRTGKHLGVGRPILPPMPWQALSELPDRDLRAIYAYLMAQPAVKNKVPDHVPPDRAASAAEGGKNPS